MGFHTHCSRGDQGLAGTARPSWGAFVSTGNSPHLYRDLGALGKVQRAQGAGGLDPTLPADPHRGRAGALQPGAAPCAPPPQRSLTLLRTAGSPRTPVSAGSAANPRRAGECAFWGPGRRGCSPPALPPPQPPENPGRAPGRGKMLGTRGSSHRCADGAAPTRALAQVPGGGPRTRARDHCGVRIPGSGGRRGGGRRAERRGRGGPRGGRPRRDAPGGGGQGKRGREVVLGGGGGL